MKRIFEALTIFTALAFTAWLESINHQLKPTSGEMANWGKVLYYANLRGAGRDARQRQRDAGSQRHR